MSIEAQNTNHAVSGLGDVLLVLSKWKKFIAINVAVVTIVAGAVSFLLPKWYRSSATVLPPKNQDLLSSISSASTALARQLGPLRALTPARTNTDFYRYLAIIKSRTLLERIARQFDLVSVYGISDGSIYKAIDELESNIDFRVNEEGTLTLEVSDRDSSRAASLATSIVVVLDEMNQELGVREARDNSLFLEKRIAQNLDDMKKTEVALKNFQEKHGFIAMNEKTTQGISAVAELYAQKTLKEIEIGLLRRTTGGQDPRLNFARVQLSEIEKKLKDVPELGIEFLRLYRDYTIQQRIYETLVPIYEQSRIEEQRDTPTLLVLDSPVVPEIPYAPRKRIIVTVFFLVSLFVSSTAAFVMERLERMKHHDPSEYDKLKKGWEELTIWLRRKRAKTGPSGSDAE